MSSVSSVMESLSPSPLLISVAVPVPTLDLLTYCVPRHQEPPLVGARVVVPLGSRLLTGVVVEVGVDAADVNPANIKPIQQRLDVNPLVPPNLVALAQWTAGYYAAGAGETITAVLPPKTRGDRVSGHKTKRMVAVTTAGLQAISLAAHAFGHGGNEPAEPQLSPKQLRALELLAEAPHGISAPDLAKQGITSAGLARLAARGLVTIRRDRVDRNPFDAWPVDAAPETTVRRLTPEQDRALERLRALAEARVFRVALIHGVTGSGKTEIYLRLAAAVRAAGRSVLILVPEIALAPATASLFRQAFTGEVAILHSGLSDGERHDEWQRIRRGEVSVVVGTRSAVFAPIERVGLIVVDEEHDGAYKQEESPRYNGRDVAIVRGQRDGALVVLGSATPSMESYHNASVGRYERVVLERRVQDRPLPSVTVVDMRDEYAASGPDVVLSRRLTEGLSARLANGEQALVLLNRRGYSTSVFCRQCAGTLDCPNCSVSLVVHGQGSSGRARCHYCNYQVRVPTSCPACGGEFLEQAGFGTERVEVEIRRACPGVRVARLDRDAIRRRGVLGERLQSFRSGDLDVLVGTQMIAKGHDFPRVTLVGVVSADVGLGMADFRASERTFQLLTQVTGRAGRGEQPGEAIIQTLYPDHYSIRLACRQDYPAFFDRELKFRREMHYPPATALINAVVRARTFADAMNDAADLVKRLRANVGAGVQVLGPAQAPLSRLRGEYRAQLLVKGSSRKRMREAMAAAMAGRPELARRTIIDVDPLSVL